MNNELSQSKSCFTNSLILNVKIYVIFPTVRSKELLFLTVKHLLNLSLNKSNKVEKFQEKNQNFETFLFFP